MKWPTDLGTWGFILSLAALLLMYPIGLLINLTSPKIETWSAGWSRDRLAKRVQKLEEKLHIHKLTELPDQVQVALLSTGLLISVQLGISVHAILGALYFQHSITTVNSDLPYLLALNSLATVGVASRIRISLRKYSLTYRGRLAEQLVDARTRLREAYSQLDKKTLGHK
jgi:hypothetical protein